MVSQEVFDIINGNEVLLTDAGRKLVGELLRAAAEHDGNNDGISFVEKLTQKKETRTDLLMLQMLQYRRVFDDEDIKKEGVNK